MQHAGIGSTTLALTACLVATMACGDIGDAELPLPIPRGSTREVDVEYELAPRSPAGPARAVASVTVRTAATGSAGEVCPIALGALLPDTTATATLVDGSGERAVDGDDDGTDIECRVASRARQRGLFQIEVSARHEQLPVFFASGSLVSRAREPQPTFADEELDAASGGPEVGSVVLRLTTPDGTSVSATCPVETVEVLSGAMWFRSVGCQTATDEPSLRACEVAIDAIFENCRQ